MLDECQNGITAIYEDHMGSDLSIVNAAKVSFGRRSRWAHYDADSGWGLKEQDANLIRYLARGMTNGDHDAMISEILAHSVHGTLEAKNLVEYLEYYRGTPIHKSPFNHVFASFTCVAPIFVARQLVKHEYLVWNEISGRYVQFSANYHMPEYRASNEDKKQGSGDVLPAGILRELQHETKIAHKIAHATYIGLLRKGVCEEQARGVLPLNLITEWRWSGSLGAFAKMASARLRPDAQLETRAIAEAIDAEMSKRFPVAWNALVRPEML